jgi:hypothetical protein
MEIPPGETSEEIKRAGWERGKKPGKDSFLIFNQRG